LPSGGVPEQARLDNRIKEDKDLEEFSDELKVTVSVFPEDSLVYAK